MEVCIVNRELRTDKKYQIMVRARYGFNHVYPSKLFTLEEAKQICKSNGYTVVAIGDIWQCAI